MLINLGGTFIHVMEIPVIIVLLLGTLTYFFKHGFTIRVINDKNVIFIVFSFLCYLGAILISSINAYNSGLVLKSLFKWLEIYFIGFLVLINTYCWRNYFKYYTILFIAPFLLILEIIFLVSIGQLNFLSFRVFPGNEALYSLALIMPFLDKRKWYLILILLICSLSVALSLSRGAWLMYFVVLFYSFTYNSKKSRKFITLFVIASILGLFLIPGVKELFLLRWDTFASAENTSNIERVALIKYAFFAFCENPIFGVGSLNFPLYFINKGLMEGIYAEKFEILEPHNAFLQVAAEEGTIGLLFFTLLFFFLGRFLFTVKWKNQDKNIYLYGLRGFFLVLISNLFYGYIASQFRFYLALFFGLVISIRQEYNEPC